MVNGTHPDDIVLFEYVEGELAGPKRAELEAHLASCAHCAEEVARVQAGRDALREARPLQLPESRRGAIVASLPAQQRPARAWPDFSLKRLVAVLTPVAAVAAVVFVLVSTDALDTGGDEGAGGRESAGAAMSEDTSASTRATAPTAGGGADAENRMKSSLLFADGPADAVAADLRAEGLDAEVVANHVEVRNATRAEVRRALRGRRDGSVRVIIVH